MTDKVINVLGVNVKVYEVDTVCKEDPRKGEYDYLTGVIRLDNTMPVDMKNNALMHEILHCIFDLLGLDDIRDDESKVQMIATALYQVFSKNNVFYTEQDGEENGTFSGI